MDQEVPQVAWGMRNRPHTQPPPSLPQPLQAFLDMRQQLGCAGIAGGTGTAGGSCPLTRRPPPFPQRALALFVPHFLPPSLTTPSKVSCSCLRHRLLPGRVCTHWTQIGQSPLRPPPPRRLAWRPWGGLPAHHAHARSGASADACALPPAMQLPAPEPPAAASSSLPPWVSATRSSRWGSSSSVRGKRQVCALAVVGRGHGWRWRGAHTAVAGCGGELTFVLIQSCGAYHCFALAKTQLSATASCHCTSRLRHSSALAHSSE